VRRLAQLPFVNRATRSSGLSTLGVRGQSGREHSTVRRRWSTVLLRTWPSAMQPSRRRSAGRTSISELSPAKPTHQRIGRVGCVTGGCAWFSWCEWWMWSGRRAARRYGPEPAYATRTRCTIATCDRDEVVGGRVGRVSVSGVLAARGSFNCQPDRRRSASARRVAESPSGLASGRGGGPPVAAMLGQ
jgi:hypothetical protein